MREFIHLPLGVTKWRRASIRISRPQQVALLRLLALATERQLPLVPMLEAFREDARGAQKHRVDRLVALLRSGTDLPDALEQIPRILPDDAVLAAQFGAQSGTLGASLRGAATTLARKQDDVESTLQGFFIYVCLLLLVLGMMGMFLMLNIVPKFQEIFEDFDMALPVLTNALIAVSRTVVQYWYVLVLAFLLVAWLLLTDTADRSLRRGVLARLLQPVIGIQSADVLRNLAIVTEAGRPLTGALSTLARYHPNAMVRQRLLYVRNEVDHGADVWECMCQARLIRPGDATVLQASETVGNLAWALQETARRMANRVEHRLGVVLEFLRPALVVAIGLVIGTVVVGLFVPLVSLISHLAMG